MSLFSMLALVDPKHGAATSSTASLAAAKLGAPIDVLIARRDPADSIPMVGEGLSGALVDQIMTAAAADAAADAAACQTLIDAWPGNAGAKVLDLIGSRRSLIAETGRTYGMTVLPCPNSPEGGGFDGIVDAALFETGRPILIAPLQEVKSLGDKVAIFWNDSAESARAVWGAAPLLRRPKRSTSTPLVRVLIQNLRWPGSSPGSAGQASMQKPMQSRLKERAGSAD